MNLPAEVPGQRDLLGAGMKPTGKRQKRVAKGWRIPAAQRCGAEAPLKGQPEQAATQRGKENNAEEFRNAPLVFSGHYSVSDTVARNIWLPLQRCTAAESLCSSAVCFRVLTPFDRNCL